MSVCVMGAGAFGTALAISLSQNGPVTLWARSDEHARDMRETRENAARLPGIALREQIEIVTDIAAAQAATAVLLAVPMQALRGVLRAHRDVLAKLPLVACCKGVELGSHLGPVGVIAQEMPEATPALLTGPSFARDIANGLPTALTLASRDATMAKRLQSDLTTANLRLYRTSDVTGAELGGALKNVIAIACGAVIGAGLGESARAALLTRGFAEMVRIAAHRGADAKTLSGLSGLGDLVLTCGSTQSRNYRHGLSLAKGGAETPTATVEGVATAQSAAEFARQIGLDMPITQVVSNLVTHRMDVDAALAALMSRPLKEE